MGAPSSPSSSFSVPLDSDLSRVPMKTLNMFSTMKTMEDNTVNFLEASKQVLAFICTDNNSEIFDEISKCDDVMGQKSAQKLKRMEVKRSRLLDVETSDNNTIDLRMTWAALKLQ